MIIRFATHNDLDTLVALEREIFPDDAWPRDMLRDEIDRPDNVLLVGERDGRIIAYAAAQSLDGNDSADVHNIAVAPAERGSGYGAMLLDALVDWCRDRGASTFLLEVRADNEVAQSLYQSRGFEPIAIRSGYYQPTGVDAIVMRKVDPS